LDQLLMLHRLIAHAVQQQSDKIGAGLGVDRVRLVSGKRGRWPVMPPVYDEDEGGLGIAGLLWSRLPLLSPARKAPGEDMRPVGGGAALGKLLPVPL
jgi:hypothetical protein